MKGRESDDSRRKKNKLLSGIQLFPDEPLIIVKLQIWNLVKNAVASVLKPRTCIKRCILVCTEFRLDRNWKTMLVFQISLQKPSNLVSLLIYMLDGLQMYLGEPIACLPDRSASVAMTAFAKAL